MKNRQRSKDRPDHDSAGASRPPKTSCLQAAVLVLVALGLFFALLEGGLALVGVRPAHQEEDPFVGFAGNVPLFKESVGADGRALLATAPEKYKFFNPQQFPREKGADTYRIFCMGGSTTFGHPFDDLTSFAGWLRELLPEADARRHWEVINAGGISYASYRVARLMEELVRYQPDLFIVYTGQNEFLEERTYGALRDIPEVVRTAAGVLSRSRTWAAMNSALTRAGMVPERTNPQRVELSAEVNAVLDQSAGLEKYRRDDALRDGILEHYRLSLERMVEIARQAGAQVIFVTPASNLKDCSPFKSEHSPGIDTAGQEQSEALLAAAAGRMREAAWPAALAALDQAVAIDPRFAELHYRRGRALFALGRYEEALAAFERARDEDVCPLRALTPMRQIVAEVAREQGAQLVDYVELAERQVLAEAGHRIPGEELFLDHVHPTVAGNRLLAVALVESMIGSDVVRPGAAWPAAAIAAATTRIEARIDPYQQAKSLVRLTKTMHWARKFEDARRSARQALAAANGGPEFTAEVSSILLNMALETGDAEPAESYIREALAADPWNLRNRQQLAIWLLKEGRKPEATAHILLSAALWNNSGQTNSLLGQVLFETGRYELAYPYLSKALQLDPGDGVTQLAHAKLRQRLGPGAEALPLAPIVVRRYPSNAPREIFLTRAAAPGRDRPDGIFTEWFENGTLKRYAEYDQGIPHGVDLRWDPDGQLLSRVTYQRGVRTGG